MSEAIDRRNFLKTAGATSLAALVGTAEAQEESNEKLIYNLRNYLQAMYDLAIIKKKDEVLSDVAKSRVTDLEWSAREKVWKELESRITSHDFDKMRKQLIASLSAHSISVEVAAKLTRLEKVPELEEHFKKLGMDFRLQASEMTGYELLRFGQAQEETIMLFGESHNVPFRTLEEEPIPHINSYAARYLPHSHVKAGQFLPETKTVELRPNVANLLANKYYLFYTEEKDDVKKSFSDPNSVNKEIPNNQIFKFKHRGKVNLKFWIPLGKQLSYQSLREIYETSPDKETFIRKSADLLMQGVKVHEAMHFADDSDIKFLEEHRHADEAAALYWKHSELRCYLATLAHTSGKRNLTEIIKTAATGRLGEKHFLAAQTLLLKMGEYLWANKNKYEHTINFGIPSLAATLSQLPKLSDVQINDVAKGVYTRLYKGRSLEEHIKWLIE